MPLSEIPGLPVLGSWKATGSVNIGASVTFGAYEVLIVNFNVTGYTGTAIASLQFNSDTNTANYNSNYSIGTGVNTPTSALGMFRLGQNAVTGQRSGVVTIYNFAGGTVHIITCQSATVSTGSTAPTYSVGSGNWNSSTAQQITSIRMSVDTSASVTAGSGFVVQGYNF